MKFTQMASSNTCLEGAATIYNSCVAWTMNNTMWTKILLRKVPFLPSKTFIKIKSLISFHFNFLLIKKLISYLFDDYCRMTFALGGNKK